MSFLAPAALFGLLLLAIPVIVHLFKPRKMRQTPFSSLRWLRMTQQRLSRRIQWHQLLLFALRAGFIVLLVLALAKPLFGTADESAADRFVIVDVSRSMGYHAPGQPTPLERARKIAADLLAGGKTGDRTGLLFTGTTTRVVTPPVVDAAAFRAALESARPTAADTNLTSALEIIRPMLARGRPEARAELYFLTDNHQQSWSQREIAAFLKQVPGKVSVRLIDVGVPSAQNAWIAGARLAASANPPRRVLSVDVGCVGDAKQQRTVRIAGLTGLPERTRGVTVSPGRPTRVEFEIPAALNLRGQVARIKLEPADALPDDDQYFLNLDTPAALRVLLVEPEESVDEELQAGHHLRTAVEALTTSTNQALALVRRTPAAVSGKDFTEADLIVLAGVPELADAPVKALRDRVEAGAGLVVFLGPGLNKAFYNTKLFDPLHPARGLMPLALQEVTEPGPRKESPAPLTSIRWTHPLLAPLYDPVLGDLARWRFRTFYRFVSRPAATDTVLAWIDDEVPAVVERAAGAGKVILFNTTANDAWSDLPRRKSYVPLVDRLLAHLTAGGVRRSFEVGEAVRLPVSGARPGETVTVRTPGGRTLDTALVGEKGRTLLRLDGLAEPGVYRVERAGSAPGFAFVVNVGRGDSVLTPPDGKTLAAWWQPASFEIIGAEAFAEGPGATASRFVVWPWLIVAAGLLFLAEMFFVHRLCPRVNPAVAEAVVHKRGLLRPLGKQSS